MVFCAISPSSDSFFGHVASGLGGAPVPFVLRHKQKRQRSRPSRDSERGSDCSIDTPRSGSVASTCMPRVCRGKQEHGVRRISLAPYHRYHDICVRNPMVILGDTDVSVRWWVIFFMCHESWRAKLRFSGLHGWFRCGKAIKKTSTICRLLSSRHHSFNLVLYVLTITNIWFCRLYVCFS